MQKEIALICSLIVRNDLVQGPIFSTFDTIYDLALKFVDHYGLDNAQWETVDFEEAVCDFVNAKLAV